YRLAAIVPAGRYSSSSNPLIVSRVAGNPGRLGDLLIRFPAQAQRREFEELLRDNGIALGHNGNAPNQQCDVAGVGHGLNAAMTSASHTRPAKMAARMSSRRTSAPLS